ncbi:MAG: hypothetical protein IPN02_14390 [Candidatus Microthrix sp.]|uniref:D-alanine--D-alanine ligase N-terminal domain-containing protein n=1 Tax=Candidatus Neomicrothrix subdominans TaxID=2954438 RepID=A0A936NCV6_9ACTN|nr:hypothetical protein [Candidatus Microthrix subdominans]
MSGPHRQTPCTESRRPPRAGAPGGALRRQSAEHDVSQVTARTVMKALDPDRYDVRPIGIARDGRWLQLRRLHGTRRRRGQACVSDTSTIGRTCATRTRRRHQRPTPTWRRRAPAPPRAQRRGRHLRGSSKMAAVPYVSGGVLRSAVHRWTRAWPELCGHAGIPQARLGGAARA